MLNRLPSKLLLAAYSQGYFPMPHPDTDEILWYRPDPRAVLPLEGFRVSRSLRRTLERAKFRVSFDGAFLEVMKGCANRTDTWITEEFIRAYSKMFRDGFAHSTEVWEGERLVGGVYGVAIGGAFFAESKFHVETDASKVALFHLVSRLKERSFKLLEVQFLTPHLTSLGAIEISDEEYQRRLAEAILTEPRDFVGV